MFMCASFGALAAWVSVGASAMSGIEDPPGFLMRQLLKGLILAAIAVLSVLLFIQIYPRGLLDRNVSPTAKVSLHTLLPLLLLLSVAAIVAFPNIGRYPGMTPDEMHHLTIARNLAEFGRYASGNPAKGFHDFDTYDSVGPPVIAPAAAAFLLARPNIEAGRSVIATYFLAYCAAVFFLFLPAFGRQAAAGAVALTFIGFGTIYLARSLYGEIPAFFYFVSGLLAWRASIRGLYSWPFAIVAGVCLGLAILTKTFLVISACAFLGVIVYDRVSHGKIGAPSIFGPAVGVVGTMALWWLIQNTAGHDVGKAGANTILLYRSNLLFGLESVDRPVLWLLTRPITWIFGAASMILVIPHIFRDKYDPALAVFFIVGLLFIFWWIFFTPGQILRYTWYTGAVAAGFSGVLIASLLQRVTRSTQSWPVRAAFALLAALALWENAGHTRNELQRVYTADETGPEKAVVRYVQSLPPGIEVRTAHWPLSGIINFHTMRDTAVAETAPEVVRAGEVFIAHSKYQPDAIRGRRPSHQIGPYAVFTGDS